MDGVKRKPGKPVSIKAAETFEKNLEEAIRNLDFCLARFK